MKLSLVLAAFSLFTTTQAFAGAANADLKCAGKGITVEGSVPGDLGEWDFKVTKSGRSARIFSVINQQNGETEENSKVVVADYLHDAVWTLSADRTKDDYGYVSMYALPKTVKYAKIPNGYRAKFQAKVSYSFGEFGNQNENETVDCRLQYQI